MNDKKNEGFTLIETLVAITLILILTITFTTAFINILRHNEYAFSSLRESWLKLYCDQQLRKEIEPIVFPYWENSVKAAQVLQQKILDKTHIPNISINTADIILKNGSAQGLKITYSIKPLSTNYTCIVLFSSNGDIIAR